MNEEKIQLESRIAEVSVYPDRARVTRQGTIDLEPGLCRLEIGDLPLGLDVASVRASARGTARARLLGVDVGKSFFVETPAERVRELEDQIQTLGDDLQSLEAQATLLSQERDSLGQLAGQSVVFARGLAWGRTQPQDHLALLDSLRSRVEGINTALAALETRRREYQRKMDKLQGELKPLRAARPKERYTALVEVEVSQAGRLTVDLVYVVANAGWQPVYDVRLLEEDGSDRLEIGYLSQVTQRTGEDWQDVGLSLSTARPALADVIPELEPWYIRPYSPPPPVLATTSMGFDAMSVRRAAPAPEMELAEAAPEDLEYAADDVAARVENSGAAVSYHIDGTVTIPADGAAHKVTVARFGLAPDLDYTICPKLVQAAYRRARVTNDSPYTLLPGRANLFAGDEFIGGTQLELIAPQGEIELYLGVDDRIKVERELKKRQVDKRLIGSRRRLHYAYETTLENLLGVEVLVTLEDQLPVSLHEDIRVTLDAATPTPEEHDDLNLLTWKIRMGPAEKAVVRFEFTVEHPKDMAVTGLI